MNRQKRKRPLNLKDIAGKAGVSKSTVSRVINGGKNVNEDTLQKVQAIIEEEGFVPNPGGRILHLQQTYVIGVVFLHSLKDTFEDPYYFPLFLQGVNQASSQRGYATLLWVDSGKEDEQQFYQRILANRLVDGVLVASSRISSELIERLLQLNDTFVMVERPSVHTEKINYVGSDNVAAAEEAVRHLIDRGYSRIGTITGRLDHVDGRDRLHGYKKALSGTGYESDEKWIVEGDFSYSSGYHGMKKLLTQNIDAVFAATDRAALGALQAIQEAKLAVPHDIAIVGFDDLTTQIQPPVLPLTSTNHFILEKSARATTLLIDLIEGQCESPQQIVMPTELVIRNST